MFLEMAYITKQVMIWAGPRGSDGSVRASHLVVSGLKSQSGSNFFIVGITAIFLAWALLYMIQLPLSLLLLYDGGLIDISSLGLLTLFFIIGIGYTRAAGLELAMTSSGC